MLKSNIIIYLCFWAVYAPFVLIAWHDSNGTLLSLSIALLIGLGIVLAGMLLREKMIRKAKRRTFIHLESETDENISEKPDPLVGFRFIFSKQNTEVIK